MDALAISCVPDNVLDELAVSYCSRVRHFCNPYVALLPKDHLDFVRERRRWADCENNFARSLLLAGFSSPGAVGRLGADL